MTPSGKQLWGGTLSSFSSLSPLRCWRPYTLTLCMHSSFPGIKYSLPSVRFSYVPTPVTFPDTIISRNGISSRPSFPPIPSQFFLPGLPVVCNRYAEALCGQYFWLWKYIQENVMVSGNEILESRHKMKKSTARWQSPPCTRMILKQTATMSLFCFMKWQPSHTSHGIPLLVAYQQSHTLGDTVL